MLECCTELIFFGLRPIQWFLASKWDESTQDFDKPISTAGFPWGSMTWFFNDKTMFERISFKEKLPDHHLFTNASEECWGAHLKDKDASGATLEPRGESLELKLQGTESSLPSDSELLTTAHKF